MTITELKNGAGPVLIEVQELDRIAEAALCAARMLMEVGVRAKLVHEDCAWIARGLGAERVELCSDYASLGITVKRGTSSITKTVELGSLGVNYRLSHAIRGLAQRIWRGGVTPAEALSEMMRLKQGSASKFPGGGANECFDKARTSGARVAIAIHAGDAPK